MPQSVELVTQILLEVVWHKTPFLLEKNPIYIGHIRAHSDLPAGNDCIDKALIGEALVSDPIVWLNVVMIKFIFLVIT